MKLHKKKILILGASSDIGLELLKLLNSDNYEIGAHCYRSQKTFKKISKKKFSKFRIFRKSLVSQKDAEDLVSSYIKWSKGIDILVHLTGNVSKVSNWTNLNEKNLVKDIKVNFLSTFFIVQKIFKVMKKGGGKIILTGTSSANHGGGEDSFGYGISKSNLIYLSKAVARFGGKYNISIQKYLKINEVTLYFFLRYF